MYLKEICELIGLTSVRCERCGRKHDALPLIRVMFQEILKQCKKGNRVVVDGFGIFDVQVKKGRTHKTPLMKGGFVKYNDRRWLSFKQSKTAKRLLREDEE